MVGEEQENNFKKGFNPCIQRTKIKSRNELTIKQHPRVGEAIGITTCSQRECAELRRSLNTSRNFFGLFHKAHLRAFLCKIQDLVPVFLNCVYMFTLNAILGVRSPKFCSHVGLLVTIWGRSHNLSAYGLQYGYNNISLCE